MTPEQKARQKIDQQLDQCGWIVQDYRQMDISAGRGVAVREFPLSTGEADYLLYADAKAIGVIEAKPEDHTLTGVELQSAKYTSGLPKGLPHYHLPLPFAYESTGVETRFTNGLDPDARSREVFTFHRPEELIRMATLGSQLRANLRQMPELITNGLWNVQVEAIRNLEASFADNRPRAVIQMATGSGKTFTACTESYRLIKFGKAKRILFTEEWRAKHPPKETASQLLERILKERRHKWEEDQLATYANAGKKPPSNWKDKYKEPTAPDETDLPALPEGWCWTCSLTMILACGRPFEITMALPISLTKRRPSKSPNRGDPTLRWQVGIVGSRWIWSRRRDALWEMTIGETCSAQNATNSGRHAPASLTSRASPLWFGLAERQKAEVARASRSSLICHWMKAVWWSLPPS